MSCDGGDLDHGPLRLSPAAVAAAVLLLPGPLGNDPIGEAMRHEVDALDAHGYVRDGALAPWVARRLRLLLAPDLHAEAIVASAAGRSVTEIWARVDAAIIGRIDARGWVDVSRTDPRSLAWAMREVVGISDHADASVATHTSLDTDRLARFEEALSTGDHRHAHEMVTDGEHHNGEELAIMAALACPERRTWRVTARWTSSTGAERRWVSALDAGRAGLWCSHGASAESTAAGAAPLVATSAADLWHRLIATLPPGTSDVPSASPVDGSAPSGRAPCPPSPPNPTGSSGSSQPPMTSAPA